MFGDVGTDSGLSWTVEAAVASRGRSQVVQSTARISFTVVQWAHSQGDKDGLENNRKAIKLISSTALQFPVTDHKEFISYIK